MKLERVGVHEPLHVARVDPPVDRDIAKVRSHQAIEVSELRRTQHRLLVHGSQQLVELARQHGGK